MAKAAKKKDKYKPMPRKSAYLKSLKAKKKKMVSKKMKKSYM